MNQLVPPALSTCDKNDGVSVHVEENSLNSTSLANDFYDLNALNARISTAKQTGKLIGPDETAELYLDIKNLNQVLRNKKVNDIFVFHVNAVSWVANFASFTSLFDRMMHPPDIICITETRLQDKKFDWQKRFIGIRHYEPIRYDNSPSDAGGVAVYMREGIFHSFKVKKSLRLDSQNVNPSFSK